MLRRLLILFALCAVGVLPLLAQQEPVTDEPAQDEAAQGEAADAEAEEPLLADIEPLPPEPPPTPREELFLAIELKDTEAARRALEGGAEPEISRGDPSPLGTAALHNDLAMVRLLLDFGGDPSATGDSPLEEAIRNENTRIVVLLMESGARVPSGAPGQEFFRLAQRGGRARELSAALLDHDADPTLCLAAATDQARVDLMTYCLERGADRGALPEEMNILSVALASGDPEIVDVVVAGGLEDRVVAGALAEAVAAGDMEIVRLAIDRGAVPGFAHIEAAVESRHPEIGLFLLNLSPPKDEAVLAGGDVAALIQRAEDLEFEELSAALRRKSGIRRWTAKKLLSPVVMGVLAVFLLLLARGFGRSSKGRAALDVPRQPAASRSIPPAAAPRPIPDEPPFPRAANPDPGPMPAPAPERAVPTAAVPSPTVPVPGLAPLAGSPESHDSIDAWEIVPEADVEAPAPEDDMIPPVAIASEGEALLELRMPEVDLSRDAEEVFKAVRQAASGEAVRPDAPDRRQIVLVTPARVAMLRSCPRPGSMPPEELAAAERLVPAGSAKNVAAIAYNDIDTVQSDISSAIPFFDLLKHLGYLGHAVWIFEGHVSAMAAGCHDADVLIVDDGMMPYLPGNWRSVASRVMRGSEVFLFERKTGALRRLG